MEEPPKHTGRALFRVAIITMVLLLGAAGLYWLVQGSGPREANRVTAPAGYSIICPDDWTSDFKTGGGENVRDSILLRPNQWKGPEPSMWVKRLTQSPDLEKIRAAGFSETKLSLDPAWMAVRKVRRDTVKQAFVLSDGQWFDVGVLLPETQAVNVHTWWRYAETFRARAGSSD